MVFLDRYGCKQPCGEALAKWRRPDGFRCQHCGRTGHCHLKCRDMHSCDRYERQVLLTGRTLFAASKLPLHTSFVAIRPLIRNKHGISALAWRR